MSQAALISPQVISRYFSRLAIYQDNRETAFFTVNKHWAPLVVHGRTPIVLVVSYLDFIVSCDVKRVNKV
jgi:hypothetical protein